MHDLVWLQHIGVGLICSVAAALYRIGDPVQVLYDPQSPENAAIKSLSKLFLMPAVATVVGVTLFGIALRPIFLKALNVK